MTNKNKKLVSRPKNGNLRIASTAPWMGAKTDTPTLENQPSAANFKLSVDDFRWQKHLENKNKTDELRQKEYTEKQILQAENTRTWRSDAADIMHGLGEAAFASNPYTATSYFGAKALDGAFKNGITPETVVNAGYAAMPWMHVLAPMILSGVLKGALFMTSNITGKWTPFFGREYRLNPNIVGVNGGGIQSRPITRYTSIDDLIAQNTAEHLDGTRVAGLHEFARALGSDMQGIVDRIPMDGSVIFFRNSLLLPGVSGAVRESQPGVMRQLLEQNLEPLIRKGLIPGEPIQANPNAPYRTIDDLIERNTNDIGGGLRMAGVRNATRELGYNNTGELLNEVPTNAPVIVNSPIPGTFTLEEAHAGGFRTALEGKLPQLIQRGIIRETVAPKPSDASLSQLRGQVVKATDPRVADVPREELAKYGIGLDMSEGGTPYQFSDLFISPSDPAYGVTLSDFASKDPGHYNTAYWNRPNNPNIIKVAKYYGAKLNRQALADEGRRIQLNNPLNISGSFGALNEYDLNVLSYLNAMRNMLKQQKVGRQIITLNPKLNPYVTERNGYIRMNELFQGPRFDDSQVSPEFIEEMRNIFNKGEQTVSRIMGQAPTDPAALSKFLEDKAGFRSKLLWREGAGSQLIDPSKFKATPFLGTDGSEGFKLSLDGKDAGFLRAVPRKEIFDDFTKLFDLLRNKLGLKLPDPIMESDGSFFGPKLTTITLKKGGKSKLIKRCK